MLYFNSLNVIGEFVEAMAAVAVDMTQRQLSKVISQK